MKLIQYILVNDKDFELKFYIVVAETNSKHMLCDIEWNHA